MIDVFNTIKKILRWLAGKDAVKTESPLKVDGTTGHDIGFDISNTTSNKKIFVGVGSSGSTRGIYDYADGKWMLYSDGSHVYLADDTDVKGRYLDLNTANTSDTWVPVLRGNAIQHRVIPAMIGTRISPTIVLANSNVETVNASSVECVQLNATEYLCEFTVRLTTTQDRTNIPACRFQYDNKVLTPKANRYNFSAHIGSTYGGGWWNGSWLCFSGTWNANTTGEMYGSFIGELK